MVRKNLLRATFDKWFPRWKGTAGKFETGALLAEPFGKPVRVGLVVWPLGEERCELAVPREQLLQLLRQRMGAIKCWEETITGVRWVIVRQIQDGKVGTLEATAPRNRLGRS